MGVEVLLILILISSQVAGLLAFGWLAVKVQRIADRLDLYPVAETGVDPVPDHRDVPANILPAPRVFVPPPDQAKLLSREADAAAMARRAKLDGYTPDRVRMIG